MNLWLVVAQAHNVFDKKLSYIIPRYVYHLLYLATNISIKGINKIDHYYLQQAFFWVPSG